MLNVITAKREWFLPGAIVLAGVIVAISLFVYRSHQQPALATGSPAAVHPLSPSDHIIGNPSASVLVIEYADIDSAYSKAMNATMEQLMTEYAAKGTVAWVYRHFPIIDEHPEAAAHAAAAECAGSLGTTDTFFRFIDGIQADLNEGTTFVASDYAPILARLGIKSDAFGICLATAKFDAHVRADAANAVASGGTGAPYTILLIKGQEPRSLSGAVPYDSMKKIIEQSLSKAGS